MASRKNLVLASLVSLVMVLSFGIGLVPMLTVSPDQSANAAPGAAKVAISVDGTTPVGASYAVPVGSEQGFSALRLTGGGVEALGGGAVEWSLASDGSAKLVSGANDAVATVQAVAPGEAGLYVRTADGLVAVVDLTFSDMKAVPPPPVQTVTVTSPLAGSTIIVPANQDVVPFTLTADTDSPEDVALVRYTTGAAHVALEGYGTSAPYAVVLPDLTALSAPFVVQAQALSKASGQYVSSSDVTFTVVTSAADGSGNGIPDDPFNGGLNPDDQWVATVNNGTFNRTVGMTLLGNQPLKAVDLPSTGVVVTLADPNDASRWVRVTAPGGLVQAGQDGLLLVAIADSAADLLGGQAANLAPEPLDPVAAGLYVSVNVLVQENATWTSLSDVSANPVVIEMGGLSVTANQSAGFEVHPASVEANGGDAEILVPTGQAWEKAANGSFVDVGLMSAELTTLGVVAPFEFAASPNVVSISNTGGINIGSDRAYSTGGESVRISLENVTLGAPVTVTFDGAQAVTGTVDNTGGTPGVTVTVPAAAALAQTAASATVDVRVDVAGDFDSVPGGLTYVGPRIDSVTPSTGGVGTVVTIQGAGFENDPGTTVTIGGVSLTVLTIGIDGTSITARIGNTIPDVGAADVVVTNGNGYTGVGTALFTTSALGTPTLTSVTPSSVYSGASYRLNLVGTNFIANAAKQQSVSTQVYFTAGATANPGADTPAASVETVSSTLIRTKTPATLPPGIYSIYVSTLTYTVGGGANAPLNSNLLPVGLINPSTATVQIASVVPNAGPLAGGTSVTITGTGLFPTIANFTGAQAAAALNAAQAGYTMYRTLFGTEVPTYVSVTPTEIVALTPAAAQGGLVDVRVENPAEAAPGNFAIAADAFLYEQPRIAVTPLTAFSVTGPFGGALNLFTPGSKDYTVANSGTGSLTWTATVDQTWLTLSSTGGTLTGGQSQVVSVSVNAGVTTLSQGQHVAIVTFDDGDNATEPITTQVGLTVGPSNQAVLSVTPATDLSASGPVGGPFAPDTASYTVQNAGPGTLNWTASADQAWVTVLPASGALTGVQTDTVVVTINNAANALPAGTHTATVSFSDGTTTVTRQVSLTTTSAVLSVDPQTAFASFGPFGGPFTPESQVYQVTNAGTGNLVWQANLVYESGTPDWLTLTTDATSATVSVNSATANLPGTAAGTTYTATLEFTGNGGTTSRTVSVTVYARAAIDSIKPISVAPPAGGMTVYLNGSNFQTNGGTTRVFFTNAQGVADPAVDAEGQVTVFSDNVLAVVTPPHAAGAAEVYVRTSVSGIDQNSNLVTFTFAEPTLIIDDVNPAEGPIAGGTQVTITGSNLPNAGVAGKSSKLLSATGTTLALSTATYNIYGAASTVQLNLTLLRGAEADYQNGPASITGSFLFDPALLEFVTLARTTRLRDWYGKNFDFSNAGPGRVTFVISGGSTEMTTYDNQVPTSVEEPHDPNAQLNPFPMGSLTFRVLAADNAYAPVTISDLAMADSDAVTFPEFDAQNGAVDITASSAVIQIEDQTVNDAASTVDVDFNLFRPAGANLLTGPADIEFLLDYDQVVFNYLSVDGSPQVFDWYGKIVTVADNPTDGVLTVTVAEPTKQGAEITTVDPNNSSNQLNPFPLGTLHFGVKQGANLNNVEPFTVTGLTMLDKNGQPFAGGGGLGEVGEITVSQMPQVFIGANAAESVQSSTSTEIVATTPPGDRRETVDVVVVDPSQPAPGNYGFKADSFTYLQPEVSVTPATDFVTTASVGSTVFDPASAAYQVYNSGNGTLNWTASVDQTWVTLDATSGSVTGSDSDTVTVSINAAEASQLAADNDPYVATVTFDDGDASTPVVERLVILTITGEAIFVVEPDPGVEFTGIPGGPFLPPSRAFTVYNGGGGNLSWTVTSDVTWLDLAPASGVNAGTVVVTLNSEAEALAIGTYTATVTFASASGNATRTVTLTILPEGEPAILVTPETGLAASGQEGGTTYLPSSQAYTVYNAGGGLLSYTAVADASWVYVLNGEGDVVGGNSATVTAMIDATAAAALPAAATPYVAALRFYDSDAQTPDITRTISLTVFDLTVTSPNGGEEFQRGQQVPITWSYTGPASNASVRIELINNNNVVVDTIAALEANASGTNTFTWTVPETAALGRNFRIQVRSTSDNRVTDTSDAAISIIEPVFVVLNPAPGEEVEAGAPFTIRWNYFEIGDQTKANEFVDVYLYKGEQEVSLIASNVANHANDESEGGVVNTLVWDVPAGLQPDTGYRIVFKAVESDTILGGMPVGGTGFEVVRGATGGGIGLILAGLVAALLGLAGGGGDGGGGGPCFIATAAYGTPMAAQIDTLREFRDLYLLSNPLGMVAADAYYHISPAIADVVAKYPVIAALVRMMLVPVILMAKMAVAMPIPSMMLAALGTVMMALRRLRRSRKA